MQEFSKVWANRWKIRFARRWHAQMRLKNMLSIVWSDTIDSMYCNRHRSCGRMIANIRCWCSLQIIWYNDVSITRYSCNRTMCNCKSILQSSFVRMNDECQHEAEHSSVTSIQYECHTMFVEEHWVAKRHLDSRVKDQCLIYWHALCNSKANDVKIILTAFAIH